MSFEPCPDNRPTGAQLLIQTLEALGVRTLFGYPGGAIMPVYDALVGSRLKHILVRHEQGAAFAADAFARASGQVGVCMATSGPGATNLVTGIANAMLDSVPMVVITGNVATSVMGTDAFQEIDILGVTLPIVKHSFLIRSADQIPALVSEAFKIAAEGRPGPVLIDLPKDVAACRVETPEPAHERPLDQTPPRPEDLRAAETLIKAAQRPLLYLGGGVVLADAVEAVRDLVERAKIPVVTTLKGLGCLRTEHPLNLGMLGMHGTRAANLAVQSCDLLICVGARFDDRATGKLDTFAPLASVIHFDADPAEIHKLRRAEVSVCGDLKAAIKGLNLPELAIDNWRAETTDWAKTHAFSYDAPGEDIYAPALLKALSEQAGDDLIVTCDVGQHQMWVAQHCRFSTPQAHITSAGLGAMGFGLPAGIGAKLAMPEKTVISVSGDGGFMMNVQELATVRRYGIPLKIVLIDNASLGMVRQWQELFYQENYSEIDLSDNPDFAVVAQAFGIEAFSIAARSEVQGGIERLLAAKGPILMHVKIDPRSNVWPLVPPGKSNSDMMERAAQ